MVIANIFCLFCYVFSLSLIKKQKHVIFFRVIFTEVIIYLILAIIMIGENCGFELYCLTIISICYYTAHSFYINDTVEKNINPFFYSLVSFIIFVLAKIYIYYFEPCYVYGTLHSQLILYLINFTLSIGTLVWFMSIFVTQIIITEKKMLARTEALKILAKYDSLTGLFNRRSIDEHVEKALKCKSSFSIILGDIDDFKSVNDTYGHDFGDLALMAVSNSISNSVRVNDIVSRWGGEEILIFLPNCTLDDAAIIAEKVCKNIANLKISRHSQELVSITMSFGVASSDEMNSIDDIIAITDKKLYKSKAEGKNRVTTHL